ncbi:hypothetical protein JW721_04760 [Candidatus Micrarchaeota archaeon]|nr:hypothetical protein [Candidatus Micrarchaeota archaeon]
MDTHLESYLEIMEYLYSRWSTKSKLEAIFGEKRTDTFLFFCGGEGEFRFLHVFNNESPYRGIFTLSSKGMQEFHKLKSIKEEENKTFYSHIVSSTMAAATFILAFGTVADLILQGTSTEYIIYTARILAFVLSLFFLAIMWIFLKNTPGLKERDRPYLKIIPAFILGCTIGIAIGFVIILLVCLHIVG